jgi:hypothetical protein
MKANFYKGFQSVSANSAGFILLFVVCMSAALALPDTKNGRDITEILLERAFNKQLPPTLITASDIDLQSGKFDIVVTRQGQAVLNSSATKLLLALPINVHLVGKMRQTIGPLDVDLKCDAQFDTEAGILLMPRLQQNVIRSDSKVTIPVPPVNANCDGLVLPVAPLLQAIIDEQSKALEMRINEMLEKQVN